MINLVKHAQQMLQVLHIIYIRTNKKQVEGGAFLFCGMNKMLIKSLSNLSLQILIYIIHCIATNVSCM